MYVCSVINLSQGEVHRETVAMSVDPEEEPPVSEKPGLRLQKLRNELQSQIAQRRSEMWQQKSQPLYCKDENKENCDGKHLHHASHILTIVTSSLI